MSFLPNALFADKKSAALGTSAPVDSVPVGFMVLATSPLILWLLDGTVAGFASAILVIGVFSTGMMFLSIGHKNHLAYDAQEVARRPQVPFKLIGSILVALVVGLLAAAKIGLPTVPGLIGFATFILCLVSFGLDPMRDKGLDNPAACRRLSNQKKLYAAENRLERLLDDIHVLCDDDLNERSRIAVDSVMSLLSTIDLEADTMRKIAPTLEKVVARMEMAATEVIVASDGGLPAFQKRRYLTKMQALADAFGSRALKIGIGEGRNSFELKAELLFDRMSRKNPA